MEFGAWAGLALLVLALLLTWVGSGALHRWQPPRQTGTWNDDQDTTLFP